MPAPVVAAAAARSAGAGASRAGAGRAAARRGAGKATASTAAQQRAAIDAIKANREPEPEPATSSTRSSTSSSGRRLPSALTDQRGAPSWTRPDPVRAANSGAGFVLGLGLYAAGLVYLREGAPGVKRWLAAKFLNRVEG